MNRAINFKFETGIKAIFPANSLISNWQFKSEEESEAILANAIAEVADKNGLGINDIYHIFPLVLRMLKSKSVWAQ